MLLINSCDISSSSNGNFSSFYELKNCYSETKKVVYPKDSSGALWNGCEFHDYLKIFMTFKYKCPTVQKKLFQENHAHC